mmetsp:Transcript_80892/g.142694  ORF Transcript_80892/g.142694 Transcript_80892/m.142694 type:complete len:193 (+) Transcript_80892:1456-2034(+)
MLAASLVKFTEGTRDSICSLACRGNGGVPGTAPRTGDLGAVRHDADATGRSDLSRWRREFGEPLEGVWAAGAGDTVRGLGAGALGVGVPALAEEAGGGGAPATKVLSSDLRSGRATVRRTAGGVALPAMRAERFLWAWSHPSIRFLSTSWLSCSGPRSLSQEGDLPAAFPRRGVIDSSMDLVAVGALPSLSA